MLDFLEEQKTKFFIAGAIIATVWAYLITTNTQALAGQPIWMQFLATTVIAYSIPSLIVGFYFDGGEWKKVLGIFMFTGAVDLLAPPLAVDPSGVVNASALFAGGSVDVFLASIWQTTGINGFLLFLLVYPVSFIILLGTAIYLLTEKEFEEIAHYT